MRKLTLLLLLSVFFQYVFAQSKPQEYTPSPPDFARRCIELLKQQDSVAYCNIMGISLPDIDTLFAMFSSDSLISQKLTSVLKVENADSLKNMFYQKISKHPSSSYAEFKEWQAKESIDVQKLQYVRTYYKLEYSMDLPIENMRYATILCKYDSVYYGFYYKDIIYCNSNWRGGKLKKISKFDKNLNIIEDLVSTNIDSVLIHEPVIEEKKSLHQKFLQYRTNRAWEKYQKLNDSYYSKYND